VELNTIIQGDAREVLKTLPEKSIHCCVTSPPYYGLRDYGVEGQVGLEETPEAYVANMVEIFREVRRVLRDDGTLWLNLGDSYATTPTGGDSRKSGLNGAYTSEKYQRTIKDVYKKKHNTITPGLKPKDLIGIPWRVAFALQADGWWLRQDIIWHKPNPMPESVTDRCTKAHEYIFLLTKKRKYFYDREAIREDPKPGNDGTIRAIARDRSGPVDIGNGAHIAERVYKEVKGANKQSVWTVATKPFKEAHFAVFPPDLIRPCILAGCPVGGIVLDPFMGSGTTALVAFENERNYLGIELNPEYIKLANRRLERRKIQGLQVSLL
jgi:DNA modification methylase